MLFVGANAAQYLNRLINGRLIYDHWLEAALQGRITFDVLTVFVQRGRARDLRDLHDVAGFMSGHGYCAHCRGAAFVATRSVRAIGDAVEAHAAAAGCPSPALRHPDPFAAGSPEREALAAAVREQLL